MEYAFGLNMEMGYAPIRIIKMQFYKEIFGVLIYMCIRFFLFDHLCNK